MPLPINQHFAFESHQRQQCIRTLPRNYSINQMTHEKVPALTVSNDKLHRAWRLCTGTTLVEHKEAWDMYSAAMGIISALLCIGVNCTWFVR